MFVVEFAAKDLRGTYEFDMHVRRQTREPLNKDGLTPFEAWIKYLDLGSSDLPNWLVGPRVARYFATYEAARAQGFDDDSSLTPRDKEGPFPLIIEQGRLQLRVPVALPSEDSARLLEKGTRHALAFAGLDSSDLMRLDAQGRLARRLHRIVHRRPDFFDLSGKTTASISYVPARSNNSLEEHLSAASSERGEALVRTTELGRARHHFHPKE